MTEEQKARLLAIFNNHGVSEEDREFWFLRLGGTHTDLAERTIALFEAFPGEIGWFRSIQERKEKALAASDDNAWEEIIKEEKGRLGSLSDNHV